MPVPTTFSIVAFDESSGEIGVAVASKFLGVGAVVPFVRAGVGAVATQANANTSFGPRGLDMLAQGANPADVARELSQRDERHYDRQFGIVAARANAIGASFTGSECITWAGGIAGLGFAAQGNCLAGPGVVDALVTTFGSAPGALADRLIAALSAAEAAGGDKRGKQSAALIVEKTGGGYEGFNDRYVDLRVDDHAEPVVELARILEMHKLYFLPALPENVMPIDAALGAEIANQLHRLGLFPADQGYGPAAHDALVRWMHIENLENRVRTDGTIDRETLTYLRGA